jgi:HNH endonuclease
VTKLLIQPSGGAEAQTHYENTVRNAVKFQNLNGLIDESILAELQSRFPSGECAMWGLKPGLREAARRKWEEIDEGDIVAFTGKKRVFATGRVESKFRHRELARFLWGVDELGETWEYMYSLSAIAETDIPYSRFNELLGDDPNNNHMGFRVVDEDKAKGFFEFIEVHQTSQQPEIGKIVEAIRGLCFEDIQVVIDEWELLGREEFLKLHSLNRAFKYFLAWGEDFYDAKPIAVEAIRRKHSELSHLRGNSFGGDYSTIARPLILAGWEVVERSEVERTGEEDKHEKVLSERTNIGPVEKHQLVKARRGQGQFRHNVMLYEKFCRITGISDPEHLRASHIKPWSKSSDMEKLDGQNGLMLAPHVDHLFDRGWISFSDDGSVLCSPQIEAAVLHAFHIDTTRNVGPFSKRQAEYLAYHREFVLRKS